MHNILATSILEIRCGIISNTQKPIRNIAHLKAFQKSVILTGSYEFYREVIGTYPGNILQDNAESLKETIKNLCPHKESLQKFYVLIEKAYLEDWSENVILDNGGNLSKILEIPYDEQSLTKTLAKCSSYFVVATIIKIAADYGLPYINIGSTYEYKKYIGVIITKKFGIPGGTNPREIKIKIPDEGCASAIVTYEDLSGRTEILELPIGKDTSVKLQIQDPDLEDFEDTSVGSSQSSRCTVRTCDNKLRIFDLKGDQFSHLLSTPKRTPKNSPVKTHNFSVRSEEEAENQAPPYYPKRGREKRNDKEKEIERNKEGNEEKRDLSQGSTPRAGPEVAKEFSAKLREKHKKLDHKRKDKFPDSGSETKQYDKTESEMPQRTKNLSGKNKSKDVNRKDYQEYKGEWTESRDHCEKSPKQEGRSKNKEKLEGKFEQTIYKEKQKEKLPHIHVHEGSNQRSDQKEKIKSPSVKKRGEEWSEKEEQSVITGSNMHSQSECPPPTFSPDKKLYPDLQQLKVSDKKEKENYPEALIFKEGSDQHSSSKDLDNKDNTHQGLEDPTRKGLICSSDSSGSISSYNDDESDNGSFRSIDKIDDDNQEQFCDDKKQYHKEGKKGNYTSPRTKSTYSKRQSNKKEFKQHETKHKKSSQYSGNVQGNRKSIPSKRIDRRYPRMHQEQHSYTKEYSHINPDSYDQDYYEGFGVRPGDVFYDASGKPLNASAREFIPEGVDILTPNESEFLEEQIENAQRIQGQRLMEKQKSNPRLQETRTDHYPLPEYRHTLPRRGGHYDYRDRHQSKKKGSSSVNLSQEWIKLDDCSSFTRYKGEFKESLMKVLKELCFNPKSDLYGIHPIRIHNLIDSAHIISTLEDSFTNGTLLEYIEKTAIKKLYKKLQNSEHLDDEDKYGGQDIPRPHYTKLIQGISSIACTDLAIVPQLESINLSLKNLETKIESRGRQIWSNMASQSSDPPKVILSLNKGEDQTPKHTIEGDFSYLDDEDKKILEKMKRPLSYMKTKEDYLRYKNSKEQ